MQIYFALSGLVEPKALKGRNMFGWGEALPKKSF